MLHRHRYRYEVPAAAEKARGVVGITPYRHVQFRLRTTGNEVWHDLHPQCMSESVPTGFTHPAWG